MQEGIFAGMYNITAMKNEPKKTKSIPGKYKAFIYVILIIAISLALFVLSKPWRQDRLLGPEDIKNNATGIAVKPDSAGTEISLKEKKEPGNDNTDKSRHPIPGRTGNDPEESEKMKIKMKQLKKEVKEKIKKFPGKVGLVIYETGTGKKIGINTDEVFESASLVKIPIMLEVYNRMRDGKITEDDLVMLRDYHKVGGSGVLKNRKSGTKWKVSKLIELMIEESDNTATDMLIELLGMKAIEKSAKEHGMKDTTLRRKIYAFEEIDRGKDNLTTPQDMFLILKELYEGEKIESKYRAKMLNILKGQKRNDIIPRHLPKNVECAHKTGGLAGTLHDCGIVYPARGNPYILVLMSKNVADEELAKDIFADISKMVHRHLK